MKVYAANVKKPVMAQTEELLNQEEIKSLIVALLVMAYYADESKLIPQSKKEEVIEICQDAFPVIDKARLPIEQFGMVLNDVIDNGAIDSSYESLETFLKAVMLYQRKLSRNVQMSPVLLELLNDARLMAAESESAKKRIEQKVGMLKVPFLTELFSKPLKKNPQRELLPQLEKIVQDFGGEGYNLDVEEAKKARTTDPDKYQTFLALRRQAREMSKEYIRNWVRKNADEKGLAKYSTLLKSMKKDSIIVHTLPSGFKGYIDDQSRLYTKKGLLIDGTPGGGYVKMNPQYDAKTDNSHVFKAYVPGAVSVSNYYTTAYKAKSNRDKFLKVESLGGSIKKLRKKWIKIIRNGGKDEHDERFLAALVLEIIYHTQGRIGGVGNQTMVDGAYKQTFGITTLQMKHVRKVGQGINFNYIGKKAGKQRHKMVSSEHPAVKKICKLILSWKEDRRSNDPIFMTRRGGPLRASVVNRLLKSLGAPEGVTVHKLRHLKGTQMLGEILEKHPYQKKSAQAANAAEVTKWLKSKALAIGKQLGHMAGEKYTATTAISNYLEPKAMLDLYKSAETIPPKTMLKLVGVDPNSLDGYGFDDLEE